MNGEFDRYPMPPEAVWSIADGIGGTAGDVERLGDDVHGAHRPAQLGVAGLLENPMIAAEQPVQRKVDSWLRSVVFASGVIRYFGDGVYEHDREIDELNRRWREALGSQFGVPAPDTSEASTPHELQQIHDLYGSQVAIARQDYWQRLERQRVFRIVPTLDDVAQEASRMLDAGHDDEESVLALYQAGVLPAVSPVVFAGTDFGAIDPEQLMDNLLNSGRIPEFGAMTDEEIDAWLRNHPTEAEQLQAVFAITGPLSPAQERVAQALGRLAAWEVNRGLDMEPGRPGLDQIEAGSERIDEINARYAETGSMTAAERAYLEAWYDAVGADNLAALPGYVTAATQGMFPGIDYGTGDTVVATYRDRYLSPIADGIMNLSHEVGDMANMPQSIQDLANTEIGVMHERYGPGMVRVPALDEDGNLILDDFTVAGLEQYGGFVSLLETSTVEGSTEFTKELGESALRVKQELNTVAVSMSAELYDRGLGPEFHAGLQRATSDGDLSRMLSIVARNEEAASAMLIDDDNRPLLLGLNWYDDGGVVDIIRTGTSRDADGDGHTQAEATLALIQEVGGDRDFYLDRMTDAMHEAVVDTGITWIDMIARPATTGSPSNHMELHDIFGDEVVGFQLSVDDRHDFLTFIAGTEVEHVTRFRGASVAYAEGLVAEALQSGNPDHVNMALHTAGELDGAITRADFSYLHDELGAAYDEAKAAHEAEMRRRNGHMLAYEIAAGAAGGVGGPVGAFVGAADPLMRNALDDVLGLPELAEDETPSTLDELFDDSRIDHLPRRDYFFVAAHEQAGTSLRDDFPELYDADGNLRPLEDIATDERSSDRLQDLQHAASQATGEWEREHNARVNESRYTEAHNGFHNQSAYRPYEASGSWTDGAVARQRLYGEDYVGDGEYRGGSRWRRWFTTDPDDYYTPRGS